METSYHSYPKVYGIGHPNIRELFDDEVVVTEKVDGSQFSFGVFNGELRCRSRGQEINIDTTTDMFSDGVETVKRLAPKLHDGWTYRGEYLQKPKHNTLCYSRIPKQHIILFDINDGWESYVHYDTMVAEGKRLDLEVVPLLHRGNVGNSEVLLEFLNRISILGGQHVEGVVAKNYLRFGRDGKQLMGKHVSEKFKEMNSANWKKSNPGQKDIIRIITDRLRTEARWEKQVQHLKEKGELLNEPKDIGALVKELQADIREECEEEIKSWLYTWAIGNIQRGVSAGIAEWYKDKLLKSQFE